MPPNATTHATVDYSQLKVTELRSHLKKLGLDTRGRKAELIERLEQLKQQVSRSSCALFFFLFSKLNPHWISVQL